ncbi:right-handed parallel beta-helix repeat-containing protein [Myxococcota bacterium]|nr:right-handed parallel beta-helix repeat-containing protein [Myxococcota bacterium]
MPARPAIRPAVLLLCAATLPSGATAATIAVDGSGGGGFLTIQEGILAAANGDVVEVAPGTYAEEIDFLGKDIVVVATEGPDATFIVGGGDGAVVTFHTAEGPDAVLDGFDVSGGDNSDNSDHGGGIDVYLSSPTLRDLVVHGNRAFVGGGILLNQSDSRIERCVVRDNLAASGAGGGIYSYLGDPLLDGVEFSGNLAHQGGGLFVWGGLVEVQGGEFTGNTADHGGGARLDEGAMGTLTQVVFQGNQAEMGAGLYVGGASQPDVVDSFFVQNVAGDTGGGVRATGADTAVQLWNCLVEGNSGANGGGGLDVEDGPTVDAFSTDFVENTGIYGGGTLVDEAGLVARRCLWYRNEGSSGGAVFAISADLVLEGNRFANNSADPGGGNGGAAALQGVSGAVRANLFLDNGAYSGGGLHVSGPPVPDVHNNTLVANAAEGSAGGIRIASGNADVRGNVVAFTARGSGISTGAGVAVLAYNDVFGNPDGAYSGGVADPTGTDGNTSADPDFVAFASDGDGLADDLTLGSGSACRDAGDPSAPFNDPDGSRNDQGAYGGPGAAAWDLDDPPPPEPGDDDDDDSYPDDDASDDDASDDDASGDDDDDATAPGDDDVAGDDDSGGPGGCDCDASGVAGGGGASGVLVLSALAAVAAANRRRRAG